MIIRNPVHYNLKDAFFNVEEEPVCHTANGKTTTIPGYKAIVDKTTHNVLSVVSSKYRLILNEEAYKMANYVIKAVFDGKTLADFQSFNILMPKTKGSCRIDLIMPNNFKNLFNTTHESWTPFIRISNSYNKTIVLKYVIGFCRWICLNGFIFGECSFTLSMNHLSRLSYDKVDRLIISARRKIGDISSIWSQFERKMTQLKNIPMPMSSALAMFCKAFDIKINKDDVSSIKEEILRQKAKQILEASNSYFKELGNNGYAMMNVLTDFASFPAWTNSPGNFVDGYQRKVGVWIDDFLKEAHKEGFSPSKYLGPEYQDAAYYLESLVQHD